MCVILKHYSVIRNRAFQKVSSFEILRRFTNGVPDRTKLTMFDLIYYNPSEGSRMSTSSSRRTSRASSTSEDLNTSTDAIVPDRLEAIRERLEEEAVDDVASTAEHHEEDEDDDEENKMPVPKVCFLIFLQFLVGKVT
jgi:hypothetical protein